MKNNTYIRNNSIYNKKGETGNLIINICLSFVIILSSAFLIFSFVYISTPVVGSSMQPTLNEKGENKSDIVYINKFSGFTYNDLIVIKQDNSSAEYIIKRVIALAGDKVKFEYNFITGHYVLVLNGEMLDESDYVAEYNMQLPPGNMGMESSYFNFENLKTSHEELFNNNGELVVPVGTVFALGDNRGVSQDSTTLGPLPIKKVVGKVDHIIKYGQSELVYFFNRYTPFKLEQK